MRIWDISPKLLCRKHLLGEHRELHALWTILTEDRKGYRKHPETIRWEGKLQALYLRHELLVEEMNARSYKHHSPLNSKLASGLSTQSIFVHTPEQQIEILKLKNCDCAV